MLDPNRRQTKSPEPEKQDTSELIYIMDQYPDFNKVSIRHLYDEFIYPVNDIFKFLGISLDDIGIIETFITGRLYGNEIERYTTICENITESNIDITDLGIFKLLFLYKDSLEHPRILEILSKISKNKEYNKFLRTL